MANPVLQVSVNGGAPQTGKITCVYGDTLDLTLLNTAGISSFRWEFYAYPPDWPTPSGWSKMATAEDDYTIYYVGPTPPQVTLGSPYWGHFLLRPIVNGDRAQTDTSTVVQVLSPNGIIDIAPFEAGQFDTNRVMYTRNAQRNLRLVDAGLSGVVGRLAPWTWTLDGDEYGALNGVASVGNPIPLGAPVVAEMNCSITTAELIRANKGLGGTTRINVTRTRAGVTTGLWTDPVGDPPQIAAASANLTVSSEVPNVAGAVNVLAGDVFQAFLISAESTTADHSGPRGLRLTIHRAP
jgi:hypothetical protein